MIRKVRSAIDSLHSATAQAMVFDKQAWDIRLERLGGGDDLVRRMGFHAIHYFARKYPDIVHDILIKPYVNCGYEIIGIGQTSTVIKMDNTALKVMRSTSHLSDNEKLKLVDKMKQQQNLLTKYIGEYALQQEFEIAHHPIKNGKVVVARQPIVKDYGPIEINNQDRLDGLTYDDLLSLRDFVDRSIAMSDEVDYTPDILGSSNIGFDEKRELVVVDTIPTCNIYAPQSIRYLRNLSDDIEASLS